MNRRNEIELKACLIRKVCIRYVHMSHKTFVEIFIYQLLDILLHWIFIKTFLKVCLRRLTKLTLLLCNLLDDKHNIMSCGKFEEGSQWFGVFNLVVLWYELKVLASSSITQSCKIVWNSVVNLKYRKIQFWFNWYQFDGDFKMSLSNPMKFN